jgi:hypothetical protein
LAKQNELLTPGQSGKESDSPNADSNGNVKKLFVEPEISVPVDVLEATTFLQLASSGALP